MKREELTIVLLMFVFAVCAIPVKRNTHVAYGTVAARGDFPAFVAVSDRSGNQFCGGTLINSQYVLTAAHCTDGNSASQMAVIIDRIDLRTNAGQQINVAQIIQHPQYDPATTNNDIAILRLQSAVSQSTYVKYGDIHTSSTPLSVGTMLWVCGYGQIEGGGSTDVVRKVQVPIAQSTKCSQFSTFYTNTMLCAGDGQRDACPGDSGGPMGFFSNGTFYVAGVVSWGPDTTCGTQGNYGAYARVSTYTSWIRQYVPAWSTSTPSNPTTGGGSTGGTTTGNSTTGGTTGGGSTGGGSTGGGTTTSNSTTGGTTPGGSNTNSTTTPGKGSSSCFIFCISAAPTTGSLNMFVLLLSALLFLVFAM